MSDSLPAPFARAGIFMAAVLAIAPTGDAPAWAQARPAAAPSSVREEVAQIRNDPDPESRYRAIQRVAFDLHRDSSRVVADDVTALTGLLRDRDDLVRHWAALAIGQIGPRASQAAPALQAALVDVECVRASKNSLSGILFAFGRIGVSPVLAECIPTWDYRLIRRPARD